MQACRLYRLSLKQNFSSNKSDWYMYVTFHTSYLDETGRKNHRKYVTYSELLLSFIFWATLAVQQRNFTYHLQTDPDWSDSLCIDHKNS